MVQPSFLRLLYYLLVFAAFFLPPVDTDLGWHLRYGSFMLENQRLFVPNQLTYFLPDYIWPNSYTLYQIITTFLFNSGGFFVLSFSYGILGVISFWLFQKLFPRNLLVSLFIFLSIVYFSWTVFNLGWRAQTFSFTFLIANYLVIKQVFATRSFPKYFPFLYLFWPSLHGGFVLGLFVQLAALVQSVWLNDKKLIRLFSFLLITSSLFTLANPYGFGTHLEVLNHVKTPLGGIIAEWTAPSIWHIAFILLLTPTLLFLVFSKKQNFVFWAILLLAFAFIAIPAKRNLSVWALAAGVCVLTIWRQELEAWSKNKAFVQISTFALIVGSLTVALAHIPHTLDVALNWGSYCDKGLRVMPCAATDYIKKNPPEGKNVFSAYEWGGFIAWQLPKYKYFVDGRMPAWTIPSPYTTHLEILRAEGNFLEKLESYGTNWLLIPSGTYLDLYLSKNQTPWREKYRDRASAIFIKL